jgi:hypothetical protein
MKTSKKQQQKNTPDAALILGDWGLSCTLAIFLAGPRACDTDLDLARLPPRFSEQRATQGVSYEQEEHAMGWK